MNITPKDPSNYEAITYAWVLVLSLWGGISGYVRKIKGGNSRFSLSELIGELCVSGFVGVLTFLLCESAQITPLLSAAFVGISGHMGSRSILILEKLLENKVKQFSGGSDDPA